MRVDAGALVADAWARWKRDRELLLAVAGPFWFLPSYALALLVPAPPPRPDGVAPADAAASDAFAQWLSTQGPWYLLAWATGAIGTATVYCLYLDRAAPDVRAALRRGLALWPRLLLLGAMVALVVGAGLLLLVLPGLYLLGRLLPAAPALAAERPVPAIVAFARGFQLSRGAGLPLMAVVAATLGLSWLASEPLLMLEAWLRARPGGENMVAIALCDAGAAAVATAGALASALLAVAAYQRLASRGI